MQAFLRNSTRQILFVLLSIALFGCLGTPSPTPAPTLSPTAHTVYLPGVGDGETSPIPTATPPPASPTVEQSPSGPTPLPPPVPKPGYGVQVHLLAGDMAETLRWARGLGVGWVKQQVEWHTIEHGKDDFDWALLDGAVEACDGFGFRLLLGVTHAPDWTRSSELESGPPADYAEFGRFMEQLATRYRGRVAAYELWNEPNLTREWRGDTLDAARFVALVAEGARGVRAGDPEALVISGAPAVTGINDGVEAIDD
ncbi:MAG: cellulase family glycosylhydrolase, partial [Chloroflexota bacterium]|nr:cellulase family glycosylhydrolase [Chloroflexota bacterium]